MSKKRYGDHYANMDLEQFEALLSGKRSFKKLAPLDKPEITWRVALRVFKPNCGDGWNGKPKHSRPRPVGQEMYMKALDVVAQETHARGEVWDWRKEPFDEHLQEAGKYFDAWLRDYTSLDPKSGLPNEHHFIARAVMVMYLRDEYEKRSV